MGGGGEGGAAGEAVGFWWWGGGGRGRWGGIVGEGGEGGFWGVGVRCRCRCCEAGAEGEEGGWWEVGGLERWVEQGPFEGEAEYVARHDGSVVVICCIIYRLMPRLYWAKPFLDLLALDYLGTSLGDWLPFPFLTKLDVYILYRWEG